MFKILLISLAASATFLAAEPTISHAQPMKLPLVFEPNQGQAIPQAEWIANGPGYQLAFTKHSMMIHLNNNASKASDDLQIELPGSGLWNHVTGLKPTGGVSNYPGRRSTNSSLQNVPHYARIQIANVYKGVDLEFYSNAGELEYDFIVHPGADPNQIQLAFMGARKMHIDNASGDLILETVDGGNLRELCPTIYQQTDKRLPVNDGYKMISANKVGLTLGTYDKQRTLIIDPVVKLSTFLNYATSSAIAVDKNGTSYITGGAAPNIRLQTIHNLNAPPRALGGCLQTTTTCT